MRNAILLFVLLAACGGGGPRLSSGRAPEGGLDPVAYLLEVGGARTDLLRADDRSIEDLEAARDAARGPDRRRALIDLARAHMLAAGASDDRETRRHRSSAERFAEAAANGSHDDTILAQSAFVELWLAYRSDDRNAAARAERFTTRHAQSGELALIGWIVRGELAFAAGQWRDAIGAYRYVLGQLGHPLYAFALYRTAQSHERAGETEEGRQALGEVALLGCDAAADEATHRVALQAARDLGGGTRREGEREVPATCPERTSGGTRDEPEGWRPAE